jgi:replicative DNA helicase
MDTITLPDEAPSQIPQSTEAELAVCGAVLINPDAYYEVASFLNTDDFFIHRHQWIWQAFGALHDKQIPIDLLTVSEELDRMGRLADVGGAAYIMALINQVPSSLNAESYGRIIEAHAIRRKMITAANQIASLAYDEKIDISQVKDLAFDAVEKAVSASMSSDMKPISELVSEQYDRIDTLSKSKEDDTKIITTGLIDLDKHLRIRKKNLVIIAARPGIGKTGLALTIASHAAMKRKKRVAIFSLEMDSAELVDRLTAQESGINLTNIIDAKMDERDWPVFTNAVETVSDCTMFINDDPDITVPQMRAFCKKLIARYGLDLIIVDYLGLMDGPGENRTQQVSYISRNLKKMAKALNVPVIALHQLNREIEKRGDGEPQLSDLRDSGSVEQDADAVLFLYVKGESVSNAKINVIKASIAKQRNGPKAKFDLAMHTITTKFDNIITPYTPR